MEEYSYVIVEVGVYPYSPISPVFFGNEEACNEALYSGELQADNNRFFQIWKVKELEEM